MNIAECVCCADGNGWVMLNLKVQWSTSRPMPYARILPMAKPDQPLTGFLSRNDSLYPAYGQLTRRMAVCLP